MPLNYKALHKILTSMDYVITSQKGSHIKYRKWSDSVIVPKHKEIKKWTASSILKDMAQQSDTTIDHIKKEWSIKL